MRKLLEYLELAYAEAEYRELEEVALLILLTLSIAKNKAAKKE